ncbi:unnamed protein product [Discula destructiva]
MLVDGLKAGVHHISNGGAASSPSEAVAKAPFTTTATALRDAPKTTKADLEVDWTGARTDGGETSAAALARRFRALVVTDISRAAGRVGGL